MNKIHYICNYYDICGERDLVTQPSGVSKINYIKSAIKRAGFYISVYSVAQATTQKKINYSKITKKIDSNEDITYINCFGRTNILLKIISRIWMQIQLLYYLFNQVKSSEIILIYHSLILMWPIRIFRLFSKKKIIFEIEELYYAVQKKSIKKINLEIKYLQISNGYILINDLIASKCGFLNKPFAVCYGDYRMTPIKKEGFDNTHIHLVYAGGIEGDGSDVHLAIESMSYLPNKYKLHILGFGTREDIIFIEKKIAQFNFSRGKELINYNGHLSGYEYFSFLSKCHIGLCTRVLANKYSDYTFPSKVLIYLANNLIPICTPISSVMSSQVGSSVIFTQDTRPQSIAYSILSIQKNHNILRENLLNSLDEKFLQDVSYLLNH